MSQENNTEIFLRATTSPSTNRNLPEKQQTEEPACLFFHTLSPIAPLNKGLFQLLYIWVLVQTCMKLSLYVLITCIPKYTKIQKQILQALNHTRIQMIQSMLWTYLIVKKGRFSKGKKKKGMTSYNKKKQAFRDLYLQLSDLYFKRKHFFLISNNPCSTHT